jgi:hypothetical protein
MINFAIVIELPYLSPCKPWKDDVGGIDMKQIKATNLIYSNDINQIRQPCPATPWRYLLAFKADHQRAKRQDRESI